jgi:hypothetical protein
MNFIKASVVFLFLLLFLSTFCYSQHLSTSIGVLYGFENPNETNSNGIQLNFNIMNHQRVSVLISIGYAQFLSPFSGNSVADYPLELQERYTFNNLSKNSSKLLDGDLSITYLEFAPKIIIFENFFSLSSIYSSAGFGLYFPEYRWSWNTHYSILKAEESENFTYAEGDLSTNNFGFNFRLGIEINISSWSKINIEGKYLIYNPKLHYELQNRNDESLSVINDKTIKLNTFFISSSLVLEL